MHLDGRDVTEVEVHLVVLVEATDRLERLEHIVKGLLDQLALLDQDASVQRLHAVQ